MPVRRSHRGSRHGSASGARLDIARESVIAARFGPALNLPPAIHKEKHHARYTISRRTLLSAAAAFGAAGTLGMPGAAFAKAPPVGTQAPFFYRIKLGDLEATVVSDGPLVLGPLAGVYPDAPKEEFEK